MTMPRKPSTTLKTIEKLFGPVLPGPGEAENTISVFEIYTSRKKYKSQGKPGLLEGAAWHLHTPLPLVLEKIKGEITGISEEGHQHDPNRRDQVTEWLNRHDAAEKEAKEKKDLADKKKRSTEAKKAAAKVAGEYEAELKIPALGAVVRIRIKVGTQRNITLVGKNFLGTDGGVQL